MKVRIELTEKEVEAVLLALGCPLDGDDDDCIAVFGNLKMTAAAARAAAKLQRGWRAARADHGLSSRPMAPP